MNNKEQQKIISDNEYESANIDYPDEYGKDKRRFPVLTDEIIDQKLKVGPRNITLSGAEHYVMHIKSRVAEPSDEAVDEMRHWSVVNEK